MTTSLDSRWIIDTSRIGAGSAVEVTGTLDWHSAPGLRAALSSVEKTRRVLIDLTDVKRIDSSGTGELIAAAVRANHTGRELGVLTGTTTADILDRVGIGDSVLLFSDRASAYTWASGERAGYPLGR